MDDFSARSTYVKNGDDEVSCYRQMHNADYNTSRALVRKMQKMFQEENEDETLVLGKYRVGEVQQGVVSVGKRVELRQDDGTKKAYLLLRVIPVNYLEKAWVFPTEFTAAEISIITADGEYVIQSKSMKSRSLLDFIRGYNFQDDYNKVEDLAETLKTTDNGLLEYKNSRNEDCYWYYSSFGKDLEYVGECLEKVSWAGNHLLTLINDILYISNYEKNSEYPSDNYGTMLFSQPLFWQK